MRIAIMAAKKKLVKAVRRQAGKPGIGFITTSPKSKQDSIPKGNKK
jgi:hypothetical protein